MPSPTDVANVMWTTLPFAFAALVFTLRSCVQNLSINRVILVSSCALAVISNPLVILMTGAYPDVNTSLVYLVGVTTYNMGLWSSRLYVCLRMANLCPSPAISASFNCLAYVSAVLFVMTMAAYIMSTVLFYRTHPFREVAETNETAVAIVLIAELMFEITSIYLHAKCLKMFASSNPTGLKLCILSCSTLTCIAFGMIQCSAMITGDVMLEVMMGGLQVAGLPSSIVLGEAVAFYIGRGFSKSTTKYQLLAKRVFRKNFQQ